MSFFFTDKGLSGILPTFPEGHKAGSRDLPGTAGRGGLAVWPRLAGLTQ